MTPTEFSDALTAVGWSKAHLAQRLGCHTNLLLTWGSGRATVPPPIAAWLLGLAKHHAANPPPPWRKHPGFGLDDRLAPRSKP